MTTGTSTTLPQGLTTGTWALDLAHTEASFTARHAAVTKVRGTVKVTGGELVLGDTLEGSSLTATLDPSTVSTGNEQRDGHLKSADFFDIEKSGPWTFVSTAVAQTGESTYVVTGDLTINGITRSVDLDTEFTGVVTDPWGGTRAGAEASLTVSRKDFGMVWNVALEAGGVLVSDKVVISLDVAAVKQA
jgi:polyisoprenoid-binding protein YceI